MDLKQFSTKIFLDSGDPKETKEIIRSLGFLDGQTTNPSLIAKNPQLAEILKQAKLDKKQLMDFYKKTIREIASLDPNLDISIEVYADKNSTSEDLQKQAFEMQTWVENARIKFPTTVAGIQAAVELLKKGGKANMTLIFEQAQVAAIHKATESLQTENNLVVSPFIGRLDDINKNGMDLIKNILEMNQKTNSKIKVLAASIRDLKHIKKCFDLRVDIITGPNKILKELPNIPLKSLKSFPKDNLEPIPFENLDFTKNWKDLYKNHELTEKGLQKFADDWNGLLS